MDATIATTMAVARQAAVSWGSLPMAQRLLAIRRLVRHLVDNLDDLAAIVASENGKPTAEALSHDVGAAVSVLEHLYRRGEAWLQPESQIDPWWPVRRAVVHRRPHGVVLIISPWNFPIGIPVGQVGAALAAGNTVILKPSESTPVINHRLATLFAESGLPEGVVTVVHGDGKVGAALVAARPDKVCFTGSVAAGRAVMAACSAHPIPVSLELGGVDAMIVCEDADLDLAASAAVWGAFANGGQICASVERLLVHASVRTRLLQRIQNMIDGLDPRTDLGKVTVERQKAIYDRHLKDARARGLEVTGGQWLDDRTYAPTLVQGQGVVEADVWREESFGPIVAVAEFKDDDEAIRLHNDSRFGLTASIFTGSAVRGEQLAGGLRAGLVAVNDVAATLHAFGGLPWGGVGESGFGRSHGREGLLEMTWAQVVDRTLPGLPEFRRPWWYPYGPSQTELMRRLITAVGADTWTGRGIGVGRLAAAAVQTFVQQPRL